MNRKTKKNCGVYAHLDATGVLENGTGTAIEEAKAQYWKKYKRDWRKNQKMGNKEIEVVFTFAEYRTIKREAERNHTNPTRYIKHRALDNSQKYVDPVSIGELRELIILHHNSLLNLSEKNILPSQLSYQLLKQIASIEERVLKFLSLHKQRQ